MNREQLAHILRAACDVTKDPDILVIGSQSVLASYDEDQLPAVATASMEADIAFLDDPDEAKADQVDGAIGELSPFHEQFGYYAQGVSLRTAVLPRGWRDRLVQWRNASSGRANAVFLEKHDLVVSKLVALRERTWPSRRRWSRRALSTGRRCTRGFSIFQLISTRVC